MVTNVNFNDLKKTCSNCNAEISVKAEFCRFCGKRAHFDHLAGVPRETLRKNETKEIISEKAHQDMRLGLFWVFGGVFFVTTFSPEIIQTGDIYWAFLSPIVYGIYRLLKGIYIYFRAMP